MSLSFKVDTELTWAQGAESKFYRCRKEMDKRGVLSTWSPDRKEPQVLSGQRKENGEEHELWGLCSRILAV